MNVSVFVLTRNEAQDIPGCLASVSWSNDVHILDSGSTDDTMKIAAALGAKVHYHAFAGYASQRNAALALDFVNPWVLILDADERIPEESAAAVRTFAAEAGEGVAAARLRRRDYLDRTWLKRAQISPFYLRLVRPKRVHYEREVNEVLVVNGETVNLDCYFNHFPFSKGMSHWVSKHNQYSTMEAARAIEEAKGAVAFSWGKALWAKSFNERRYHQKGLFYRFPLRPVLKWFYIVLWRRAFLDGRAGITYATLQAIYEYFIVLKEREKTVADPFRV